MPIKSKPIQLQHNVDIRLVVLEGFYFQQACCVCCPLLLSLCCAYRLQKQVCKPKNSVLERDVIYTSRAYAMMPVRLSVCDGSALAHYR